jgi:hypothetical protein
MTQRATDDIHFEKDAKLSKLTLFGALQGLSGVLWVL